MPKGYILGHVSVTNPEAYAEYVRLDTPILEGLGGRFIIRAGQTTHAEGAFKDRTVVIEFPSYQAALDAYNDPEYQKVATIRHANAKSDIMVIEGV